MMSDLVQILYRLIVDACFLFSLKESMYFESNRPEGDEFLQIQNGESRCSLTMFLLNVS